ncbi:hypothetical protein WJX82_006977 [Trebouxia sp. C0006]
MADTQATLLTRWAELHAKADTVEDSDRQEWFGQAAAFLQATDHWWCQHAALTGHFAEIFVYHTQPVVQRLWSTLSQQLSSCALCVVNYHVAQAQYKHDEDGVGGLSEALQLLDANRLHDVLSQAMSVQSGDTLPGNLITALFEVLSFPDLMDDMRVNKSLESALLHLKQSHELALTDGGRYQGLYRLMAHPGPQVRAMVHPMIKTLGPLEDVPDLDSIAPVLQNWADLIRHKDNAGQREHSKGKFEQPPQLVWLAMNVLLTLIKSKAMVALLEQVWPGLVDALLQESEWPSQHMWMIMGCLRTIIQVLGVQVWQHTESDAHALVQSIIRSCYESQDTRVHRAGIHALVAAVKACWTDGEDQMQQLVQQVVAFLLQGVPTSTSFATPTHNMAAGSAFGLLTDCLQQGLPIGKAVALWGPSVCRSMQQAPANGPAPNLHAASHLVLLVMASDAHALHHWNQQEWGQTHTRKTTAASLTSELCSPALWQGLTGCLPATAPFLAAAAHLAFTTAATSSTAQRAPPSSGGFHSSVGSPALPQEVQLAMHWQHHAAAADEAALSVRVAKHPGVLLGVLRQCAASHLEHVLQSGQATLPREAIADLLLVMVGVQPRLRELTQQLLLAVTNAGAVEEAVLVLMTDAAADTAAQVVAAAEKLVPMLQHAPAAQVLTRAPTMHIFNLLTAMMAADTSGTHSTAAVVVPQLWSAVLGILQHGAAAAKLSVAQTILQRLFQLLPQLWKTLQQQQQNFPLRGRHANQDVLDLTGDDDSAKRAQHDEAQHAESSLLWMSTALEWGPLCTAATVMHWAEAMVQVLKSLQQPVEQALPEDVLSTAANILAPNAGLPDKPRLLLAPFSNSNAAKQQQLQSPVKNAHSFADWLSPPWGQGHPQTNITPIPSSSSHPSRLYGADTGAQPLPVQPHSQSEQRLGQLTAMHHKPALQFQSGDQQTTTNESTKRNLGPPPSRSPSPVLMEDEELDAQLNSKAKDKGPGQRAYVGLPSAPAPEPSRRAQMISIPAAANTSVMTNAKWAQRRQNPKDAATAEVGLTIQEVQRDLLVWDYHSIIRASPGKGLKTLGMKRVPTQFQGLQDYCRVFRVLLLEELKAHLLQAEEEQQRPSSKGSSATALAQLRAMQRRSDLYALELVLGPDDREAVRGEDLLLLTHSLSSEGDRAEGSGAGQHEAAVLAIVEKVESEKELDGSRKLVAYATVCLAGGDMRSSQAQRAMTLQSSWQTRRLMSWTPHLRQFIALCHMSKLPPQLRTQLLHPVAPAKTSPATLARCGGMSNSLREQLKEHYNASQQAAIASVMCPGQALFTLLQGPPGTGKTSAIIAIISALLAKHYGTGKGRAGAGTTPASAPTPKFRILVCAQSNAAIDEVIARLASPGLLMGSDKTRRRPGMVRMGRGETMSPGVLTWAMDQVAERYAHQDGQTLQAAAKSSKGRQRCDDIKAQLNATSDQIKQAEPAEKLTAGVRQKKRKREAGDIGHDPDPVSREGSAERATAGSQKKTNGLEARGGNKAQGRDGSSEILPAGSRLAKPDKEEQRRDLAKLKGREKRGETPKAPQPGDLPALKKKRHLLYGQLQEARQEVKEGHEAAHKAKRGVRQAVVRCAEVVACTLSSAGGDLLGLVKGVGSDPSMLFNAIMIDEAAQALEPAALVPLQLLAPGGHVVLVGDPKQLPPTVLSRAAEASNLAQSLFERLQQAGYPVTMLSEQYRMHPAISAWPSLFFYQGKLTDGTSALPGAVASRAADFHKRPCFPPLAFFDCQQGSERGGARGGGGSSGGTSLSNNTEADVACTLFGGLMREYGHEVSSVAILTPYKAQLALLRSTFAAQHSKAALANVEFATVDGFQGKEADVVLFSCVRAHDAGSGERGRGVGFLADVRRMNVGLTRARRSIGAYVPMQTVMTACILGEMHLNFNRSCLEGKSDYT